MEQVRNTDLLLALLGHAGVISHGYIEPAGAAGAAVGGDGGAVPGTYYRLYRLETELFDVHLKVFLVFAVQGVWSCHGTCEGGRRQTSGSSVIIHSWEEIQDG